MALHFEKKLSELTQIVEAMEKSESTLEEALTLFERGTGLIKDCQAELNTATQRIQIIENNKAVAFVPHND